MSAMKRYCEDVSVDMGPDGEINDAVMEEAGRRLKAEEAVATQASRNGKPPVQGEIIA